MTFYAKAAPLAVLTLLCTGIAGCGGAEPSPDIEVQGGDLIDCALDGAEAFAKECRLIEPVGDAVGKWRVVHPDGGFRLLDKADGAFATADGASQAEVVQDGGVVALKIETDRYRLPQ